MTLGYCEHCQELVRIIPAGPKRPGSRQLNWHPVAHILQGTTVACPGSKRPL